LTHAFNWAGGKVATYDEQANVKPASPGQRVKRSAQRREHPFVDFIWSVNDVLPKEYSMAETFNALARAAHEDELSSLFDVKASG
jgi:hypothetical protein